MSQDVEDKKKHLEALEEFLRSPAHAGFVAATLHEIKGLQEAIVLLDPDTPETVAESFKLRGELRYAERMVTTFEDARVSLKERIDEMVERQLEEREIAKP